MKTYLLIICAALIGVISNPALALNNPAAVHCAALGYEYSVEKNAYGEAGYCILTNSEKVDAWQFLLGKVAQDKNYCAKMGYMQKSVKASSDLKNCSKFRTESCLVCIVEDGREVEVSELMSLDFDETTCGDGVCGIPETDKSCPADCAPVGCPDLVVKKVDRPSWDAVNNRSIIETTIQNVGNAVAEPTMARVIDPTTFQTTGAPYNAVAATPQLSIGASATVIFYLPYWVFNPDVTLEVTADYKNELSECNENNNVEVFEDTG